MPREKTARDDQESQYYNLLRLQRSVNKVLDVQVQDGADELAHANEELKREVEKLIRIDADPKVFKAIADAAWEAPDSEAFAKLAKETAAKVRLKVLETKYGTHDAFKRNIEERIEAVAEKEAAVKDKEREIKNLEEKLKPIFKFNNENAVEINRFNKDSIESSSWWHRMETNARTRAKSKVKWYKSRHSVDPYHDLDLLDDKKADLKALKEQVHAMQTDKLMQLASFKEISDETKILKELGADKRKAVDLEAFQDELCKRLRDDEFIACFAANTPAGVAGPVILSALSANIREKVQADLCAYQDNVAEMTSHLEGPIGILAKNTAQKRPMDGIEQDIRSQALMAGYLCESAAGVFRGLNSFRAEHLEGPISLKRDLQMHLAVNAKVDPAYIHEVCGMDSLLTKYFNVSARRPAPNFKEVLSSPDAVERINRGFSKFLKNNADDETVAAQGFAAGQFNTESIELFLFNRYFMASSTKEDVIEALEQEAAKVEELGDKRKKIGISRNGPSAPSLENN